MINRSTAAKVSVRSGSSAPATKRDAAQPAPRPLARLVYTVEKGSNALPDLTKWRKTATT